MNTRYKIWKKIKEYSERQMAANYLKPHGGCDSCCPKCKQWENAGNKITTEPLDDGSEKRVCGICDHEWKAIFTPAGFIPL